MMQTDTNLAYVNEQIGNKGNVHCRNGNYKFPGKLYHLSIEGIPIFQNFPDSTSNSLLCSISNLVGENVQVPYLCIETKSN